MKKICLTFDDGVESHYWAKNLLKDNGLKGTFFITNASLWHHGDKVIELGMNEDRIDFDLLAEFENDGFEIGSHTFSHPNLTEISSDHIVTEICSMNCILQNYGIKNLRSFCYPAYNVDQRVFDIVKQIGFKNARTGYEDRDHGWSRWDFKKPPEEPRPKTTYPTKPEQNRLLIRPKGVFNFIYKYEDFLDDFDSMTDNEVAVFVFHGLKEASLKKDFEKVVSFLKDKKDAESINFGDI